MLEKILKEYQKELIVASLLILTYVPTFIWMWDRWWVRDSYYSHGIFIPFVFGWLIWQMKEKLAAIPRKESGWGLPLIILGLVIHVFSSLFRIYFTSGFSLLIVIAGIVLHFWGMAIFKKILFPISFLFFMIPLPMVIVANMSFKLKLFAAQIATILLNNMGLDAIQQGSIIKMKNAHVVVDDVCSGLRSLISLMALGSLFAFMMKSAMYKRILLFICTVPIAVVTNVFRVIVLSFIGGVWGIEYASGMLHDITGFLVFALAFVLLYFVGKLLE